MRRVALFIETSREYGRGLLRGIIRYEREHGPWRIYFRPGGLSEPAPEWLASWGGDGIIARVTTMELARAIQESKSAAIDLWAGIEGLPLPTVGIDNEALSEMAFTHLMERGYRHFAYYGPPRGEHYYYDLRCDDYLRVLRRHGFDDCALYTYPEGSVSMDWELARAHLASWVSSLPRPTAIMACHDDVGLQLLEACHDAGVSVPDEIAVLGVNNDEFLCSLSSPPLSSVDMGSEHVGYESAVLLDRMMHGEKVSRLWTLFPPRGVTVRQSTDIVSVSDPVVARAVRFIRDRACSGLQVEQILRHASTSRTALYRRFKEQLGRSPKEEITRVRLERAKDLLKRTKLSIAQVASRTGYAESKYFIEVFARETGMTPLTFRKLGAARGS
ncbi:LacI family transcriptional regulator [Roseimicrobium gellanilyticum]|uniref:LacI family transcriptional regulator n=1 Tax=Roseimicrobium gellanilyticum TaxID=748857 RepID=A0A366H7D6_9BACT|nr:XylR family transcriptional regulator [Roseimicrobium gellanilyticum]RBP38082.1 LacI family transcriptional regulator [Roseimicrobium gellanilyticum]